MPADSQVQFLNAIYGPYAPMRTDETIELVALRPRADKAQWRSLCAYRGWYPATQQGIRQLVSCASAHSASNDVYVSYLPRERGKGDTTSVTRAAYLYCGLDGEAQGVAGAEAFLRYIVGWKKVPVPNIIVQSGHGLHCYWRLPVVMDLEDRVREEYASLLRRLASVFGGKPPMPHSDAGHIPSVPRLPGTFNHKDDPPLPVRLLRCKPDAADWSLPKWHAALPVDPLMRRAREMERCGGTTNCDTLPASLLARVNGPSPIGTRHRRFVQIAGSAASRGFGRDVLLLLGERFCANNPGFPFREMVGAVDWAVRNCGR